MNFNCADGNHFVIYISLFRHLIHTFDSGFGNSNHHDTTPNAHNKKAICLKPNQL
jgi:hypothetical protein